jgi:hypothetical protein
MQPDVEDDLIANIYDCMLDPSGRSKVRRADRGRHRWVAGGRRFLKHADSHLQPVSEIMRSNGSSSRGSTMALGASLIAGVIAVLLAPSSAHAIDICALASPADAATVLSQPVVGTSASKPERDEDSGGQISYCTYRAGQAGLIISVVEFATPAEARKQATAKLVEARADAADAKVIEETGIGERTFWALSSEGASYTFLKGALVVGLGAGGPGLGQPARRKNALRTLASDIAKKL